METINKIANLLLSEDQVNKDLAFSLIESLGVDFSKVLTLLKLEIKKRFREASDFYQIKIVLLRLKLIIIKRSTIFNTHKAMIYRHHYPYDRFSWGCEKSDHQASGVNSMIYLFISFLKNAYHNENKQSNNNNGPR